MTGPDYLSALDTIGLDHLTVARFLQIAPSTSRRWAHGQREIPYSVALLLRYMVRKKLKPHDIERPGQRKD